MAFVRPVLKHSRYCHAEGDFCTMAFWHNAANLAQTASVPAFSEKGLLCCLELYRASRNSESLSTIQVGNIFKEVNKM